MDKSSFLIALLLAVSAVYAYSFQATFVNDSNVVAQEILEIQGSDQQALIDKCFFTLPTYNAIQGSRLLLAGNSSSNMSMESGGSSSGNGTGGGGATGPGSGSSSSAPKRPEDIFSGRLVDKDGRPLGGETVMIEWRDSLNLTQQFTTVTLTYAQATLMGDAGLEGYYFFNKDRLNGASYTVRWIPKIEKETAEETPEKPKPNVTEGLEQPVQRVQRIPVNATAPDADVVRFKDFVAGVARALLKFWWMLLIILAAAALLIAGRRMKIAPASLIARLRPAPSMRVRVQRFLQTGIKGVVRKDFLTTTKDSSCRDVLGLMLGGDQTFCIVQEEGSVIGIITASDLCGGLRGRNPEKVKVKELMTAPVYTVPIGITIGEAASRLRKARAIPVLRGGRAVGVLMREHLLDEFDRFLSLNIAGARSMPLAREVAQASLIILPNTILDDALHEYSERDASNIFVANDVLQPRELSGILTERELLDEIYNYNDLLAKMDAARLMRPAPRAVSGDLSLLETNKIMLEQGVRTLPLREREVVIGAVTQRAIFTSMIAYLEEQATGTHKSGA